MQLVIAKALFLLSIGFSPHFRIVFNLNADKIGALTLLRGYVTHHSCLAL
uniref:Uncharacterized protein n=1 Tax=Octopus bimaculoides TaxID=37653 RepID=A0A0L8I614_OCTBM